MEGSKVSVKTTKATKISSWCCFPFLWQQPTAFQQPADLWTRGKDSEATLRPKHQSPRFGDLLADSEARQAVRGSRVRREADLGKWGLACLPLLSAHLGGQLLFRMKEISGHQALSGVYKREQKQIQFFSPGKNTHKEGKQTEAMCQSSQCAEVVETQRKATEGRRACGWEPTWDNRPRQSLPDTQANTSTTSVVTIFSHKDIHATNIMRAPMHYFARHCCGCCRYGFEQEGWGGGS